MENQAVEQASEPASTGDTPVVDPSRKALVTEWSARVTAAQAHPKNKNAFKKMRENQDFAAYGADKDWRDKGNYTVPILNRHINQAVSELYAKDPKIVSKRKRRLMYALWDGRQDTLQAAMELAAQGDPDSTAIIQEVLAVRQYEKQIDRMADTVEIIVEYYLSEQAYSFKQQIKAAVRRAKVCKVAYVKLGFQRILEPNPEVTAKIEDATSKLAAIEATLKEVQSGDLDDESPRLEELRLNLEDLKKQPDLLVREGPVFDFPRANEITIDPACRHLKSLAGARWFSHDFDMSWREVLETYKVDVRTAAKKYKTDGKVWDKGEWDDDKSVCRIHEIHDKRDRQCFTICEGWPDFLVEPAGPKLNIERFWVLFPLVFNEIEHDDEIYPPSDVESAMHIQNEYNRSRESLREHRIAARPYYVHDGSVEEAEQKKLAHHAAHEMIAVPSLAAGQKIADKLQRGPTAPIDPNLYDVEIHYADLQRTVGSQAANLGGTSGDTATESSIAENSRSVANADNVDDLDEMLSELVRAVGQLCLMELTKETVMEIVGPGAVWPEQTQTREEVARDLWVETVAGSSGRPNQAAELAKLERGAPTLIQIPGINPKPLGRKFADLLDLDFEELEAENLPSITAMNAILSKQGIGGPATGDPATDPNQQGAAGGNNATGPQENESEPGPQAAFPAPAAIG